MRELRVDALPRDRPAPVALRAVVVLGVERDRLVADRERDALEDRVERPRDDVTR